MDVLTRRSADARLPAALGSSRLTALVATQPQVGDAEPLPDQAFLKKLADRTSMDFAALVFARVRGSRHPPRYPSPPPPDRSLTA